MLPADFSKVMMIIQVQALPQWGWQLAAVAPRVEHSHVVHVRRLLSLFVRRVLFVLRFVLGVRSGMCF